MILKQKLVYHKEFQGNYFLMILHIFNFMVRRKENILRKNIFMYIN